MHPRLRQAVRILAVILLATLWGCAELSGPFQSAGSAEIGDNSGLRVVAGHFEIAGMFGTETADAHLIGREITLGRERLGIAATQPDPQDPTHAIALYRFVRLDTAHTSYCPGEGLGFPVAGRLAIGDAGGGGISIVCLGTAAARCVHLGYQPWRKAADGTSLADYTDACIRAVRADYCGSGNSHAGQSDALALYDRLGIQHLRAADGMSFEAGWGAYGAVCVNHTRAPARMTLKDLRTECANLPRSRLGNSCDERNPALIFTKSPVTPSS